LGKSPISLPAVLAALLLSGCASIPTADLDASAAPGARQVYCARFTNDPGKPMRQPEVALDPAPGAIERLPYSPRSIETARIIGVLPALVALEAAAAAVPAEDISGTDAAVRQRVSELGLRQRILSHISLASLEVSSVLAELDCEGERNDQLRDRLQRNADDRLRGLARASILVGAITAISGGVLSIVSQGNAAGVAAILGGTVETGIGLAALDGAHSAQLYHPRNLLGEVWDGRTSGRSLFPSSVWQYLNAPSTRAGNVTNRELLIEQWLSPERLGEPGSPEAERRAALLFGAGGVYSIEDLRARDAMLDMLEARVALFNQNIADLLRDVIHSESDR
jgi:hypothetical protein